MESNTKISLGKQLIDAMGGISGDLNFNGQKSKSLIEKLIRAINKERNILGGKKELKCSSIVQTLFIEHNPENKKEFRQYKKATFQVIVEFLVFAKNHPQLDRMRDVIVNLLFDFGATRFVSEETFSHNGYRNPHTHTFFHFFGGYNYFLGFQDLCDSKERELCGVFCLRQSLELKFQRIIGFCQTHPSIKLKHDTFMSILKKFEREIFWNPAKKVSLNDIYYVYKWTNFSIHTMYSYSPWLIWKAFDVCKPLFDNNNNGPATAIGIDSSVQMKYTTLIKLRDETCEQLKMLCPGETSIRFVKPEAYILDKNGNTMNFKPDELTEFRCVKKTE